MECEFGAGRDSGESVRKESVESLFFLEENHGEVHMLHEREDLYNKSLSSLFFYHMMLLTDKYRCKCPYVLVFSESLVPTVRKALCDPLEEVREAAAKTFEQLHATIGHQALDDILPMLLKQLDDEETADFALDGLKQVMAVKSRSVLPYLVPKLTAPPVNTRVLAFLSAVAGDALTRHLGVILPALLSSLKQKLGTEEEAQELLSAQTVILSVEDEVGQRIIIEDLLEATRARTLDSDRPRSHQTPQRHQPEVLTQSWDTINSITKKLDASSQLSLIDDLHRDIKSAAADVKGQHLPGFCLPKKTPPCLSQLFL
ncbi:hypothetical protein WMY93_004043 [Mugilogobius chulae]|uniref:Stalled ribosome sensor GCN1-like HEAT repeats region domain-containing protein n=1 Tax=Mugilogobius chulae TaxID=88201 RepID=A0AAW0PNG6_9GOBI